MAVRFGCAARSFYPIGFDLALKAECSLQASSAVQFDPVDQTDQAAAAHLTQKKRLDDSMHCAFHHRNRRLTGQQALLRYQPHALAASTPVAPAPLT